MTDAELAELGIGLLVAGVLAIVVEGVLAAIWGVRLSRRARALNDRLAAEQAPIQANVARLRASLAEMEQLWQPYARLLRWLRHPIVIALMQSFARRRAAAR